MNLEIRIAVLETKTEAQEKALLVALTSAEKAVDAAQKELKEKLMGMNEWRLAMMDRDNKYLTKDVYATEHKVVVDMGNRNAGAIANLQATKSSVAQAWLIIAAIVAAASSVGTILTVFMHIGK